MAGPSLHSRPDRAAKAFARVLSFFNSQSDLARKLHVSPQFVGQVLTGARPLPEAKAARCEYLTGGLVSCEKLRPDVAWHRVSDQTWPWHKAGRPMVDVSVGMGL